MAVGVAIAVPIRESPSLLLLLGIWRWFDLVFPGEAAIVEALAEENDVGEGIVDGEDDHCG